MHEALVARLEALQREYETGQTMLAELDAKQLDLRQTLLRIAGAIQVLEELLAEESAPNGDDGDPAVTSRPTVG
jgi:hypothetical protein